MQLRLSIRHIRYLPRENLTKINRSLFGVMVGMFVYGLLLPDDWEQRFGIFAQPILWAAHTVPSIGKFAAASAIPELINGFVGFAVFIPPLYAIFLVKWAFFDCSQDNGIRLILKPPDYPLIIWIFFWMFSAFVLCWFYYMPFTVDSVCGGITWGNRVCARMLNKPFSLILYGSMLTPTLGGFVAMLFGCIIRAFGLLIQGDDENGHNDN